MITENMDKITKDATFSKDARKLYKAKYDPDNNGVFTRCGIHNAAKVQERKDKSDKKGAKESREFWLKINAVKAIKEIAEGHSNPQEVARKVLEGNVKWKSN